MKTKTKTNTVTEKIIELEHEIEMVLKNPLHLKVEYFFRKRFIVLGMMLLMAAALVKSDGRVLGILREAYNHGYGKVGTYLRNETVHRTHATTNVRIPVAASQ